MLMSAAPEPVTLRVGSGAAYTSVQAAIDALPAGGGEIRIAPGTYREKLTIARPHVTLRGSGRDAAAVVLVYGDSAKSVGGTVRSATLTGTGDDLRLFHLTVANDWHRNAANPRSQAVALAVTGDRLVGDDIRLLGAQDTLFAGKGPGKRMARQYFSNCHIEGDVDFIFGDAKAYFHRCRIHALAHDSVMYTAQSKLTPEEDSAYVFDRCRLTADPGARMISLGRAWRPYATVIYLNTRMDAPVLPEGWTEWTPGKTDTLRTATYAEYRSTGRGASPATRTPFSHQLTPDQAARWSVSAFFQGDTSWLPRSARSS
jgi:pectin methylesterase-like acyl-CoA thioesterase